jgi:hypothetical protein
MPFVRNLVLKKAILRVFPIARAYLYLLPESEPMANSSLFQTALPTVMFPAED